MAAIGRGRKASSRQGRPLFCRLRTFIIIAIICVASTAMTLALDPDAGRASAEIAPGLQPAGLTIIADGQERSLGLDSADGAAAPLTVAEALAQAGVALNDYDRVEVTPVRPLAPDASVLERLAAAGDVIRVVRVTRAIVTREIPIPPTSRVRYDRRVHRPITLHSGRPGKAQAQLEIWTNDGQEVSRRVISQRVIERMQPAVVVRGTGAMPSRGGTVLYMVATGYDPGPRSCGRYASGHTAIGLHAGRGVVAVDPQVIALGTRLYVEGYGECVAGDVGGAIKGRRIDLGFDTYRQAISWGRRTVRVHILD